MTLPNPSLWMREVLSASWINPVDQVPHNSPVQLTPLSTYSSQTLLLQHSVPTIHPVHSQRSHLFLRIGSKRRSIVTSSQEESNALLQSLGSELVDRTQRQSDQGYASLSDNLSSPYVGEAESVRGGNLFPGDSGSPYPTTLPSPR